MAASTNIDDLIKRIDETKTMLKERSPLSRTRTLDIYAIIGTFGRFLAAQYFPEYDFISDLASTIEEDSGEQDSNDIVSRFFEVLDGLITSGNMEITRKHVFMRDSDTLCLWYGDVFRIMQRHLVNLMDGSTVGPNAIRKALREEEYVVDEKKVDVGFGSAQRRNCLIIDLTKVPTSLPSIHNIAEACEKLE